MRPKPLLWMGLLALTTLTGCCCHRCVRTATDITPGNPVGQRLDWRYGAADIRIQTTNITQELMDRWVARVKNAGATLVPPRIIITEVDNRTDQYVSTDMIRDIIEGVAVNDGRFTVVVGNYDDEDELDDLMEKIQKDSKYSNSSKLVAGLATAPQLLGKIRLTKAVTSSSRFDYEDYRMTITLYDIETQEIIDSYWDVLSKRVQG